MSIVYLTKQEAEKLAQVKLDGRRKYFIWRGIVSYEVRFTACCSGCSDDSEYSSTTVGAGCSECGYTGKRIQSHPVPANPKQYVL